MRYYITRLGLWGAVWLVCAATHAAEPSRSPDPAAAGRETRLRSQSETFGREARQFQDILDTLGPDGVPSDSVLAKAEQILASCEQMLGAEAVDTTRMRGVVGCLLARGGKLIEGRRHLRESLDGWRKQPAADSLELARLRNCLATVEAARGQHRAALPHYEKAIQRLEQLPDNSLLLADSYDGAGATLTALGRYAEALEYLAKARKQWSEMTSKGIKPVEAKVGSCRTHLNQVLTYVSMGRSKLPLPNNKPVHIRDYLELLIQQIKQDPALKDRFLREAYRFAAIIAIRQDDQGKARTYAEDSLRLCLACGDRHGELAARYQLASIDYRLGKNDEQAWLTLLRGWKELQNDSWVGKIWPRLGAVYYRLGEMEKAKASYQEAYRILADTGSLPAIQFNAQYALAVIARRERRLDEAQAALEKGVRIIEAAAATATGGEIHRDRFLAQFVHAYDMLVELAVESENNAAALQQAERFRCRALICLLELAGVDLVKALPESARSQKDALIRQREHLLAALRERSGVAEREQTRHALRDVEERFLDWQNSSFDKNPQVQRLLGKSTAMALKQALAELAETGCPILYYYLGRSKSHLWVIAGKNIQHYELTIAPRDAPWLVVGGAGAKEPIALTRSLAESLVGSYVRAIQRTDDPKRSQRAIGRVPRPPIPLPRPFSKASGDRFVRQALALSAALLPEKVRLQIRASNSKRVIIIPDGVLHRLPFEALVLSSNKNQPIYGLNLWSPVCYAPSLQVLSQLQARSKKHPSKPGAFVFGGVSRELPGSEQELKEVYRLLSGASGAGCVALVGNHYVTKAAVRHHLQRAGLVLFSDHARVSGRRVDNLFGYLELGDHKQLALHEISTLDMRGCRLVVLSACETLVGSSRQLETGNSLSRAFLTAGATRTIASFWSVNDESTTGLMVNFFRSVTDARKQQQDVDYAAALQSAMKELRSEKKSPYYWAPFALIGPPVQPCRAPAVVPAGPPTVTISSPHESSSRR